MKAAMMATVPPCRLSTPTAVALQPPPPPSNSSRRSLRRGTSPSSCCCSSSVAFIHYPSRAWNTHLLGSGASVHHSGGGCGSSGSDARQISCNASSSASSAPDGQGEGEFTVKGGWSLLYKNSSERGMWGSLFEPLQARPPKDPDASLINDDFSPTPLDKRIFSFWDMAALWIGLVVAVPNYYLAGSLVELGMSWYQGIITVFLANMIVLVPMVLNGHAGTKYGIPFPVLSRASFGIRGAHVPSLLRAMVACGWFGIQTWVGGQAIYQLLNTCLHGTLTAPPLPLLGISFPEFACFLSFWTVQLVIIWNGVESIRDLEKYSAPVLVLMCAALLAWAHQHAGGFGPMLSAPSLFRPGGAKHGQFWHTFFPALTANVGAWATLSLNIPDFTRYARSQRDQIAGQAVGLPLTMAAFTFVGVAVTSATVVIFGQPIPDPVSVLARIEGTLPVLLSLLGLLLATLSTNIAANVVAPANALVNVSPGVFSFRRGGVVTALVGVALAPWRLVQSTHGFIFTWLIGYSAVLGPVAGIVITDYVALRRRTLDIDALYSAHPADAYWYNNGFNHAAMASLVAGVLPSVPGFLKAAAIVKAVPPLFISLYECAWIVGFLVSSVLYYLLMHRRQVGQNQL